MLMSRPGPLKQFFMLAVISTALMLGACESRISTRGNLPDPDLLASIEPGEASRDEVALLLGSPSSVAMFENETWFYISQRTETFAFFEPEVMERQVIIVQFDNAGVLKTVATRDIADGQNVLPVERETPTLGNEPTLFQQFFGNLGRFNNKK
jgi:outer membrane protein assembly factor BamE (lipoprotein component of BamABCDE complex)